MQMSQDFDKLFTMALNETDWKDAGVERALSAMTPQPAGSSENVTLRLRLQDLPGGVNATLFLSLRAVDNSGNAGELSNIVTISRAWEPSVPMEAVPAVHGLEFYLKLVVPPVATLLLFLALVLVVVLSRRDKKNGGGCCGGGGGDGDGEGGGGGGGGGDGLSDKDSRLTASTFSLDLSLLTRMNYRHEGQYRPRCSEEPETWSEVGKSRESLDAI